MRVLSLIVLLALAPAAMPNGYAPRARALAGCDCAPAASFSYAAPSLALVPEISYVERERVIVERVPVVNYRALAVPAPDHCAPAASFSYQRSFAPRAFDYGGRAFDFGYSRSFNSFRSFDVAPRRAPLLQLNIGGGRREVIRERQVIRSRSIGY